MSKAKVGQIWGKDKLRYKFVEIKVMVNDKRKQVMAQRIRDDGILDSATNFGRIYENDEPCGWDAGWYVVEDVPADGAIPATTSVGVAINDHTCPTCQNTRCNKAEKTCWKCGNKL